MPPMEFLPQSEALTGYKVKVTHRGPFRVTGYTLIVPPGLYDPAGDPVPRFWHEVTADGRLAKLIAASAVRPWVLGLGSWDPECEPHG